MTLIRKVVDSNGLQHPSLCKFLQASRRNHIVLTEPVNAEMHQDFALNTLRDRLQVARRFPGQVVLARNMKEASYFSSATSGLASRLLDLPHTAKFRRFCRDMYSGRDIAAVKETILANEAVAQRRRVRELGSAEGLVAVYQEIASNFSRPELDELRLRKVYGEATQRKLVEIAFIQGNSISPQERPESDRPEKIGDAVNQFPFRYALAATLLFTRWVEGGRQQNIKSAKLRNDVVDIGVAAYGTYFHGLATHDAKLIDIHRELRFILRSLRGYVPVTAGGQLW